MFNPGVPRKRGRMHVTAAGSHRVRWCSDARGSQAPRAACKDAGAAAIMHAPLVSGALDDEAGGPAGVGRYPARGLNHRADVFALPETPPFCDFRRRCPPCARSAAPGLRHTWP